MLNIPCTPTLCWAREIAVAGQEVAAPTAAFLCVKEHPVGHVGIEGQVYGRGYRCVPHQKQAGRTAPVTVPSG